VAIPKRAHASEEREQRTTTSDEKPSDIKKDQLRTLGLGTITGAADDDP